MSQSWTFSAVVNDLAWLIETLLGGNAIVLGYSMGGRLALALATSHPDRVRSLILESASPGMADEQERLARRLADEHLADRIEQGGLAAFVAEWERLPMWESQAALPEVDRLQQKNIRLSHSAAGLTANIRSTGTGAQPSYWELLPGLKTPTLLIAGELDHKFAGIAVNMHVVLPDSRLEIVSDAGHAVHLEQSARYAQLVSQFVAQPVLNSRRT
jgi:2-succinyl-6-hydroxy-2,4-cyclohexadiene-1-carboxylate synthase